MKTVERPDSLSRRSFLRILGGGAAALTLAGCESNLKSSWRATGSSAKALRGIFPIAQTPLTPDNKLDIPSMIEQVKFIDRGGVHGFVWPQNASEWTSLTEQERMEGMEAISTTGKKLRPAIVLGVQGSDLSAVNRYVKQAQRVGADAIISLPPAENADRQAILEYYQQVGKMSELPLFVQAVGNVGVDLLLEMYRTIPTMRYVKDEAGDPLQRVEVLRQKSTDQIKVFSGGHSRKLIEEMGLGFSGSMPAASLADLYAQTFDLWQAGKQDDARAMQKRTLDGLNVMLKFGQEGMKFVLCERGVFKTYSARPTPRDLSASAAVARGGSNTAKLDDAGKRAIRDMLQSLKPYLKA